MKIVPGKLYKGLLPKALPLFYINKPSNFLQVDLPKNDIEYGKNL